MMILIIGFITGILSGLGVGGGTFLVPALILLMGVEQHIAQGVSLAAFLPTSLVAVLTHWRQGNVRWSLVTTLTAGSIGGALLGANLAGTMDAAMLKKVFGVFLILMGVYELLAHSRKAGAPVWAARAAARPLPRKEDNNEDPAEE